MKSLPIPTPSPTPHAEEIPAEWMDELNQMAEGSYERAEFMKALGGLGVATTVEDIPASTATTEYLEPAAADGFNGFKTMRFIEAGAELPLSQFSGKIEALQTGGDSLIANVVELESDAGNKIRVADLRTDMAESMSKVGPRSKAEQKKLDDAFWRDMKIYCDTGAMRNTVTAVSGVGYTRAGDTKLRSYWMPAKDANNTEKIRTIVRLADSGDNQGLEAKLYRKLFAIHM